MCRLVCFVRHSAHSRNLWTQEWRKKQRARTPNVLRTSRHYFRNPWVLATHIVAKLKGIQSARWRTHATDSDVRTRTPADAWSIHCVDCWCCKLHAHSAHCATLHLHSHAHAHVLSERFFFGALKVYLASMAENASFTHINPVAGATV